MKMYCILKMASQTHSYSPLQNYWHTSRQWAKILEVNKYYKFSAQTEKIVTIHLIEAPVYCPYQGKLTDGTLLSPTLQGHEGCH